MEVCWVSGGGGTHKGLGAPGSGKFHYYFIYSSYTWHTYGNVNFEQFSFLGIFDLTHRKQVIS